MEGNQEVGNETRKKKKKMKEITLRGKEIQGLQNTEGMTENEGSENLFT